MKFLNGREKSVPTLSDGSGIACSGNEKANMLNRFFVTCFNTTFAHYLSVVQLMELLG